MNTNIKSVSKVFFFENDDGYSIFVENFEEGFATVQAPVSVTRVGDNLVFYMVNSDAFVEFLSGCFNADSNFKEQLLSAYQCDPDTEFNGFIVKQGDFECTITGENSSPYKVGETLQNLMVDFANETNQKYWDAENSNNQRVNDFYQFLENLDVDFISFEAEEKFGERAEEIDEDSLWYGVSFIAYAQYLIRDKHYNVDDAVRETYTQFELIGNDVDGAGAIRFVSQFCKYGEEISDSYTELMMERFNDELDKL